VSRFSEPQDPAFQRLNASIGFDRRLRPYDIQQSKAHAAMLAARGIISEEDHDALLAGLDDRVVSMAAYGTAIAQLTSASTPWRRCATNSSRA